MKLSEAAAAIEQEVTAKLARGHVIIRLPIYEGRYAARFGLLSEEADAEFAKWQMAHRPDTPASENDVACSLVIADTCQWILARPAVGKDWEELTHDDGRPVRFDADFAATLGLELSEESADAVVRACWTTSEGTVASTALLHFAIRIVRWSENTAMPVEGEAVEGLLGGRQ